MPRRSVLLIAVAAFFAIAAPASAGYVTVEKECEPCETHERLAFYDDEGEKNSLSVSTDGEEVLVTDSATPLEAVKPCVAETANRARCPTIAEGRRASGIEYFYAFLGKGDDQAEFGEYTTSGALIEGYGGHDTIVGTGDGDDLFGGSGRDRIGGRGSGDNIDGDGWFFEENEEPNAKAVADVIDGGAGNDSIEAEGGESPQTNGGDGGDTLRGGAGDDHLVAEWMPKLLKGGAGDDVLEVNGGRASSVSRIVCGAGVDHAHEFPVDRLSRDCELAWAGSLLLTTAPTAFDASSGKISFSAECDKRRTCEGRLILAAGGDVAASKKFSIAGGATETLRLTLAPADAKRVAGKGRVFSFRTDEATSGFRMRLKANEG